MLLVFRYILNIDRRQFTTKYIDYTRLRSIKFIKGNTGVTVTFTYTWRHCLISFFIRSS